MWFDARAMLVQIEAEPPATLATSATRRAEPLRHVADVADVAAPQRQKLKSAPPARADGLDPDAAALLRHLRREGAKTYGHASLSLGWGASRTWRAEAVLRAQGLVRLGAQGRAEPVADPPPP